MRMILIWVVVLLAGYFFPTLLRMFGSYLPQWLTRNIARIWWVFIFALPFATLNYFSFCYDQNVSYQIKRLLI